MSPPISPYFIESLSNLGSGTSCSNTALWCMHLYTKLHEKLIWIEIKNKLKTHVLGSKLAILLCQNGRKFSLQSYSDMHLHHTKRPVFFEVKKGAFWTHFWCMHHLPRFRTQVRGNTVRQYEREGRERKEGVVAKTASIGFFRSSNIYISPLKIQIWFVLVLAVRLISHATWESWVTLWTI